jgi:hypothetical protein
METVSRQWSAISTPDYYLRHLVNDDLAITNYQLTNYSCRFVFYNT